MSDSQINIHVPGYEVESVIAKSDRHILYSVKNLLNLQNFVLKTSVEELPTAKQNEALRQEYEFIGLLGNITGLMKRQEFLTIGPKSFAVYLNHGDSSKTRFESAVFRAFDHPFFILVAIKISETLAALHRLKAVHRDVKPSNILLNAENEVTLIDFEMATFFRDESLPFLGPLTLNGSLEYVSPEQTGRINRPVDYRTDLYSLGVTLYYWATGHHPFQGETRLAWIYQHIAVEPIEPYKRNSNIPVSLSNMIMKLLAKEPEDRYQSATTLVSDLKILHAQIPSRRHEPFQIALDDRPPFLQISKKIYGRDSQLKVIWEHLEQSQKGHSEFLFIMGKSGLGKTALVHQLHPTLTIKNGLYLEGKFDQNQRNLPLSAFVSILDQALVSLSFESEERRRELVSELSDNPHFSPAVLAEILPETKFLFGQKTGHVKLGVLENQNRLISTVAHFLQTLACPRCPLVLFIDDLQWADQMSLEIIESLFKLRSKGSLLLIGAYRDNEVVNSQRLVRLLNDVKGHAQITEIELTHLALINIQQLLADTLNCELGEVLALAQMVNARTLGNAFYVTRFLRDLISDNVFVYDLTLKKWTWDLNRIANIPLQKEIADYLVSRMDFLHEDCVAVFKGLSLFGQKSDTDSLFAATNTSRQNFQRGLQALLEGGCILRAESGEKVEYKFCHDQLQKASYRMIDDQDKPSRHLNLALHLDREQHISFPKNSELFVLAEQYVCAVAVIQNEQISLRAQKVLINAAQVAIQAGSYEAVQRYIEGLFLLLGDKKWENYEFTFRASELLAQSLFLLKKFNESKSVSDEMLRFAKTNLDKAKVFKRQSELQAFNTEFKESYQTGLKALSFLGIRISKRVGTFYFVFMSLYNAIACYLIMKKVDFLNAEILPEEVQESRKIANVLLDNIRFFVYIPYGPAASLALCLIGVKTSIRKGSSIELAGMLSFIGEIVGNHFGRYQLALKLSNISRKMLEKIGKSEYNPKLTFGAAEGVFCWSKSFAKIAETHIKSHLWGVENGDLFFSSYSLTVSTHAEWLSGQSVARLRESAITRKIALESLNQSDLAHAKRFFIEGFWDILSSPLNQSTLEKLNDKSVNLVHVRAMNLSAAAFLLIALDRNEEAKRVFDQILTFNRIQLIHQLFAKEIEFVELYLSSLASDHRSKKRFKNNLKKMAIYAELNPDNFECYFLIAKGRHAIKNCAWGEALQYFQKSADAAARTGLTQLHALSHLNLFKVFQELRLKRESDWHRNKWVNLLFAWIGDAAVHEVMGAEGRILQLPVRGVSENDETTRNALDDVYYGKHLSSSRSSISTYQDDNNIDYETLSASALTVASEIEIESLISALVKLIKENVCADVVTVFMVDSDSSHLFDGPSVDSGVKLESLLVVGQMKQRESFVQLNTRVSDFQDCSRSCLFEILKFGKTLSSDRAMSDIRFKSDPYIIANGVKSVLGIPFMNLGKILGIIVLENRLTSGAFNAERQQLAMFIASQAGAALQNASLFRELKQLNEKLESTVQERTAHLMNAQRELLSLSRQAGASQVVTSVLHNIGNILNSLATSVSQLKVLMEEAPFLKLERAVTLANEQGEFLPQFFREDPKGPKLAGFLVEVSRVILQGQAKWNGEISIAEQATQHIKEIIAAQQSMAVLKSFEEISDPVDLVGICVNLQHESFTRHEITIRTNCSDAELRSVRVDRNRLMQVIINLLSNAKDAILERGGADRMVSIETSVISEQLYKITVKDSGTGLNADKIAKIFQFGFTTKKSGHGFGLHHCATTVKEMGGEIRFGNNENEPGAYFEIILPLQGSWTHSTKG